MSNSLPEGFYWGAATASFQIEGATTADGKGESIWDRFVSIPGNIITQETGEPACESYYRYREDVALMKTLNLNGYRFSIAWPRIIPDGDGEINEAGLGYYSRLVDELLQAGITPFVTLYHWDLPQALQDRGGWANRESIDAFVRFADVVTRRLGDRVKHWITHNEPWCISILSNEIGEHAPGLKDTTTALKVAHNLLVSHGRAVPVIRKNCPDGEVGITLNFVPADPATDSEADAKAVQLHHEKFNLWFLGPLTGNGYPQTAWSFYGEHTPEIQQADMETIAAPLDFLGVNFYSRTIIHDPSGDPNAKVINRRNPRNMMYRAWEVYPRSLHDLLDWLHTDYAFPKLYVTENGATYDDSVHEGEVHDPERIDYIKKHIAVIPELVKKGVPVAGYFCWSLMDNFEWAMGTRDRFGLIYVNFDTQKRIVKDSGKWFARAAHANAVVE